MFVGFGRH